MAYYAELDENSIVLRVLVIDDEWKAPKVAEFLSGLSNREWKEVKEDNMAGVGYKFHLNRFIPKNPFKGWILDEKTFSWVAPKEKPKDSKSYRWDEETENWTEIMQR